ncbi:plasmid stabilization system protein ParE [Parabacteroides faecis]|uniref:Plasmid stabilization system protein ParE n=1 Tax=Parabacteroides faecis TaxID=1217282 RepID=A0ABR6KR64_9BACT|nr:plasmid stabilization system protein ParE [Parabacteroides faecis]
MVLKKNVLYWTTEAKNDLKNIAKYYKKNRI